MPLAFHLGREADHLPPSSAEVKSAWSYTSTPPTRLHGVVLIYESTGTNFTFIFWRRDQVTGWTTKVHFPAGH